MYPTNRRLKKNIIIKRSLVRRGTRDARRDYRPFNFLTSELKAFIQFLIMGEGLDF